MARKGTSYSVLICFSILMMVVFIPRGLTTRELADYTPNDSGEDNGNEEDNGHSKSGVRGSQAGHAGSATENGTSPDGTVQMPPAPFTFVAYREGNYSVGRSSPPQKWNATVENGHVTIHM